MSLGIEYKTCPLFERRPDIGKIWDFSRNSIDVKDLNENSKIGKPVWCVCGHGHSWQAGYKDLIKGRTNCPECRRLSATVYGKPHMIKFWDYDKNSDDPRCISAKSPDPAWWKCPKCGYSWQASIRAKKSDKCPCCETGSVIAKGINDFMTVVPELAMDYHQELNHDLDPYALGVGSHQRIRWKCHVCGDEWIAPVYSRINNGDDGTFHISRCPVCSGNKRALTFDQQYPDLLKYFSKNNFCSLSEVKGSQWHDTYLWECEKHGQFPAVLSSMIRSVQNGNSGCPYCSGKQAKKEESLGAVFPELAKEWSQNNEGTPYDYTTGSKYNAEWICSRCKNTWKAPIFTRTQGYGFCKVCYPGRKESDSFEIRHPDAVSHYSRQNVKPLKGVSVSDTSLVKWVCDAGHEFEDSFYNIHQRGRFSCPICEFRTIVPGINDFKTLYPEYAGFYETANQIKANEISPRSSDYSTAWKCDHGHRFRRPVKIHIQYKGICPICSRHVLSFGDNDLATAYPQIDEVWDYERNGKGPDELFDTAYNTDSIYWFKCEQGHHYASTIRKVVDNSFECLVCSGKILSEDANSLKATHPDLALEWSSSNSRGPETCMKDSSYAALWICPECGGEYRAAVRDRELHDDSCPYCSKKRVLPGYNSLKAVYPEIASELLSDSRVDPDTINPYTVNIDRLNWKCSVCGGIYKATVTERVSGYKCPYCDGRRTLAGYNDLTTTHPQLAKEWSPNNDVPIESIRKNLKIVYKWICPECGGEYGATVYEREVDDESCPYCYGDRSVLQGSNDLATTHPQLAAQWSARNERGPETVRKSNRSYYAIWKCPICSGEFRAFPADREPDDCPYCSNKRVLKGFNDLATDDPELAKELSPKNSFKADEISRNYGRSVYWICPECGGEYSAVVKDRNVGDHRCPYCNGFKALPGFNTILDTDPELAKELSPDNERKPESIIKAHWTDVEWICPKCKGRYRYPTNLRELNDDSCPYCNQGRVLPGYNDLATTDPELAKEWSSSNPRGPETVTENSSYDARWTCFKCGNEYTAKVKERRLDDNACPVCRGTVVKEGINSLLDTNPSLASQWSPNNGRSAGTVSERMALSALWICPECGGEYPFPVRDRYLNDDACPYCSNKKALPGYNDLATADPELVKEWSSSNIKKPFEVMKNSSYYAAWICPKCNGEYYEKICNRSVGDDSCPYCNRGRVLPGYNDLATTDPELAKEWSPSNIKKPYEVKKNSSYYASWICPKCNGEYYEKICNRSVGDDSCPYCKNEKILPGFNDLSTVDPELAKEWSPSNIKKPFEVMKNSSYYASWICSECGGEYDCQVRYRQSGDVSCPYCSNKKILSGFNSLKARFPDLMGEWDQISNSLIGSDPDRILPNSKTDVWWICPECSEHYTMSPYQKILYQKRHMSSCSFCKGRVKNKTHFF